MSKHAIVSIVASLALIAWSGCEPASRGQSQDKSNEDALFVVTSTTMLADMVSQIGGEHVRAISIVGPGADPHLYRPTPRDARNVVQSDLIVRNGLTLEGWMDDLMENAGGSRPIITASEGVASLESVGGPTPIDPHFWFDTTRWSQGVDTVSAAIRDAVDEDARPDIDARTAAYKRELADLDAWTQRMIAGIPEARRILVTSHDAFNYFADRYDIRVVGIQGISTEQEASQRDLANVIETVRESGVPAVFVESSVNPRMVEQVARETGAQKAGPLYSDSTGPADSDAATYVGMVEANVRMIVEALGGDFEARVRTESGDVADHGAPERASGEAQAPATNDGTARELELEGGDREDVEQVDDTLGATQ